MRIEDVFTIDETAYVAHHEDGGARVDGELNPVTPDELLELASQQPDTLIIRKQDGEWPAGMFTAAAKEIGMIVRGTKLFNTPIEMMDSKREGHWAGRIVGAALDALLAAQSEEGT